MSEVNSKKVSMLIISAAVGLLLGIITACGALSHTTTVKTVSKSYCTAAITEFTIFPDALIIKPGIQCSEDIEYSVDYFHYKDGNYESECPRENWCSRIPFAKTFSISQNESAYPRLCLIHIWATNNPAQRVTITVNQYGTLPIGFLTNN